MEFHSHVGGLLEEQKRRFKNLATKIDLITCYRGFLEELKIQKSHYYYIRHPVEEPLNIIYMLSIIM
jgi:hypothetical protein